MKKVKIAAIAACSALALFACDQGLSVSEKNDAPAIAERKPFSGAYYPDGEYDLYFRNGRHVHNDCDGYDSLPHGKTVIYEYWQSDIKKWDKLLSDAGIPHETYKTGKVGRYCTITFDSDLLYGIGFEGRGIDFNTESTSQQFDIQTKDGKKLMFRYITGVYFAPAHGKFYFDDISHKQDEAIFNLEQKDCEHAKLVIECRYGRVGYMKEVAKKLQDAGANVIGTKEITGLLVTSMYVVVAASSIDWFAIGR